jgi:hypothetical protein
MCPTALIDDMGVANVGFLIENLGKDADELQYLRELVQNAFESIQRASRGDAGRVTIDYDVIEGVKKLRITDNGTGMTADEVRENLNQLSASAGIQAFDKNFGIGAKITAAVRNPHGVMYKSWKDGEGSLTILGRQDGRYGRIGWRNEEDNSVYYSMPLPEDEKPATISDSGVSVVLLGKSSDDETTTAPAGADLPSQWVAAFLERRYFQIPAGISLKVLRPVEIYDSGRGEKRAIWDTIRGQGYYLDKHSMYSGIVSVEAGGGARVWWWVLSPEIVAGGKTWNNRGHVAAMYQDELHEVRGGSWRISALKDFGIYAGHGRVVIYVEPLNVLGANTARTSLIMKDGGALDYANIGAAFADKMPDELAAYMAGEVSSEQGDHRKSILKNFKEVQDALEQARYRRSAKGKLHHVEPDVGGRLALSADSEQRRRKDSDKRPQDATGRVGSEYLRRAREELERRVRAEKAESDPLPRVVWDEEGTSVKSGRAAMYTPASHRVTANAKFDFYLDVLEWSFGEARERSGNTIDEVSLQKICTDEVRRWFEEALSQAVAVLRPLHNDSRWGPMVNDSALSDEGLTSAVVSHRWMMLSMIKRGLAGRLGMRKDGSRSPAVA